MLGLPSENVWVRVATTATWVALVIVALGAANAVVFEGAAVGSWQQRVPRLLRDLVRTLLVAVAAALAYSFIWDREIQGALTALGVTSIVVGLALQEPLGNLFSGLMLLMERPFEIGDTIEVGGVSGTVKEINWRSAHIEALGGMIQVVPNSTLNKETISNYSRPLPIRMEMLELAFSSDDPPNDGAQSAARGGEDDKRCGPVAQADCGDDRIRQPLGQLSPDLAGRRGRSVVGPQRSHHAHLVHDAAAWADPALPRQA